MKNWNIEIKETEESLLIAAPFISDSDELTPAEWAIKESVAFIAYALAAAAAATTEDYVEGAKERIATAEQWLFEINKQMQSIN